MNDDAGPLPVVLFAAWEYEHAYSVGIRRFTANWQKGDAPHYDRRLMEADRNAQVAAALCELAIAKHVNQFWHASVWSAHDHARFAAQPDVGHDIEVRRVRTSKAVAVRRNDRGKAVWAARLLDEEYRSAEILGWIDGELGWEVGRDSGRGYRLVDVRDLNRPDWPVNAASEMPAL